MKALDVARYIVEHWGDKVVITNLKLNKLVYFAQVESLRWRSSPLFVDSIEAWQYGPVEPTVYRAYSCYGRNRIMPSHVVVDLDFSSAAVVNRTMEKLAGFSAFDLVTLSHKPDGAWAGTYSPDFDNVITQKAILASTDGVDDGSVLTLDSAIESAIDSMPNALKMLENS